MKAVPVKGLQSVTVADVVDSLGLGLAQCRVALFALGVWFVDGLDICLVTVTTPTMAREFSLTHTERGLLTTAAMLGVAVGCFVCFGDAAGRKLPILISYFLTVVMNVVTVSASSFGTLLLTRLGVGIAMGMGMSPSIAMVSETTPQRWRMVMAGVKGTVALAGFLFGNLCVFLSDPALVNLKWRSLFLFCSIPGMVLGVGAVLFLPESPAFLAQSGKLQAAKEVLEGMQWLNGRPSLPIELSCRREDAERATTGLAQMAGGPFGSLSFQSQLGIIFGRNMFSCTLAALLLNLSINVINYNHNYGEPQVFTSGSVTISLEPAVQLMVANCFGLMGLPLTVLASTTLSRKLGIVLAFMTLAVLTFVFAVTVTASNKTWVTEAFFQFSMCVLRGVFSMSWNFVHQFSVEIYPVACSTTGGSIAIGVGRIGSCLAPLVFELAASATGVVVASYYIMACVALSISAAMTVLVPSDMSKAFQRAEADVVAAELKRELCAREGVKVN